MLLDIKTKTCSNCSKELPIDQFSYRVKALGYRRSWCKTCTNEYTKNYLKDEENRIRSHTLQNQRVTNSRDFITHYLSEHVCQDCGEYRHQYLTFDHVRGRKDANISDLGSRGRPINEIMKEIAKCDVVCYNCHRDREDGRRRKNRKRPILEPSTPGNEWYKDHLDRPRWFLEQEERPRTHMKSALEHDLELRQQLVDRYEEERRRLGR